MACTRPPSKLARHRRLLPGALCVAALGMCPPVMAQTSHSSEAASPLIDSLQHLSLASLGRQLPAADSAYVRAILTSPDSDARARAANSLVDDSSANTFVLALLVQEHNAHVLDWTLTNIYYFPWYQRDPRILEVLRYLVSASPDSGIVGRAVEQVRSLEMRSLETTLTHRIEDARRRGDDALVRALTDVQDRAVTLQRGIMLPTFLRRAPPLFVKPVANPHAIRVLAFGDFGFRASPEERATAAAMATYQHAHAFDFGITLGDNFYGTGLSSPSDPRWQSEYEPLYGALGIELFASFGNHDEYDVDSPPAEILYAARSKTWRFPAQFYTYTAGPVQFYAIDTNDPSEAQLSWLRAALDSSHARWKVVYGHFPAYASVEGRGGFNTDTLMVHRVWPVLKGRADVYLAGHHHSLQHLAPVDGVNLFVAGGGGAPTYGVGPADPRVLFATSQHGFAVLEATDTTFTVRFIDAHARQLYETTVHKKG